MGSSGFDSDSLGVRSSTFTDCCIRVDVTGSELGTVALPILSSFIRAIREALPRGLGASSCCKAGLSSPGLVNRDLKASSKAARPLGGGGLSAISL